MLSVKSVTICVVVVNVLLPICCHVGSGMPYMHISVEEKDVNTFLWSELENEQ